MNKTLITLALATVFALPMQAKADQQVNNGNVSRTQSSSTYTSEEIIASGNQFFGNTSRGLAEAIEFVFRKQGQPTAYIVGQEGAGAIIGGLRYGEGTIYYKNGTKRKIYWQGPSVGWDFGGNGSRTLTLVYNSQSPRDLYARFGGIEGAAYLIGGLGVNFERNDNITLAPIRTGVGVRLGANIGYLKYTPRPTWNPF
ncbi:MAG: DUF1134 domain-containing protein [Pseudomonadota bacterium]|nr:DUF1134 domain-containing protein [Pseudomonadota bacterium]